MQYLNDKNYYIKYYISLSINDKLYIRPIKVSETKSLIFHHVITCNGFLHQP